VLVWKYRKNQRLQMMKTMSSPGEDRNQSLKEIISKVMKAQSLKGTGRISSCE
jgi:hypothetical protein